MPVPLLARRLPRRPGRWAPAIVVAVAVTTGGLLATGCGEDQTGQPGVADVDFTPRLVVTVDDRGLEVSVGPKGDGDPAVSADPARLPAGSVIELRVEGGEEHRVVGHQRAPGEAPPDLSDRQVATPAPLLDTGTQRPGDSVTLVVSEPGTLELSEHGDEAPALTIEVTERRS